MWPRKNSAQTGDVLAETEGCVRRRCDTGTGTFCVTASGKTGLCVGAGSPARRLSLLDPGSCTKARAVERREEGVFVERAGAGLRGGPGTRRWGGQSQGPLRGF